MPVKATFNKKWKLEVQTGLEKGLLEMVLAIDSRAKALTPVDKGGLVGSQQVSKINGLEYVIKSGNGGIPYARRQYFENTRKPKWLEKAAESVARGDTSKYFRNKI